MREIYALVLITHLKVFGGLKLCPFPNGSFCGENWRHTVVTERWVHSTCHYYQHMKIPRLTKELISSPNLYFHSFPPWILLNDVVLCVYGFVCVYVCFNLHVILLTSHSLPYFLKTKTMFLISDHVTKCASNSMLQIVAYYSIECILHILLIHSSSYGQ